MATLRAPEKDVAPAQITEDMLPLIFQQLRCHNKLFITALMEFEFYGCFRISEVLKLTLGDIQGPRIRLHTPKNLDSDKGNEYSFKDLSLWAGGNRGLDALRVAQAFRPGSPLTQEGERLVPEGLFSLNEYNDWISKAACKAGFPVTNLSFASHGFRRGGVAKFVADQGDVRPNWEAWSETLDMTPAMIKLYAKPNTERLEELTSQQTHRKEARLESQRLWASVGRAKKHKLSRRKGGVSNKAQGNWAFKIAPLRRKH